MYWIKNSEVIAIFGSHLCIMSLVWEQNTNSIKRLLYFIPEEVPLRYFFTVKIPTQVFFI